MSAAASAAKKPWILFGVAAAAAAIVVVVLLLTRKKSSGGGKSSYNWVAGDPTPDTCSEPCGGGKAYRVVQCYAYQDGKPVQPAPDARCDPSTRPSNSVDCNTQTCQWSLGPWSNCVTADGQTVTCGRDASHSRTVTCPREESACPQPKPALTESCDSVLPFCDWQTSSWTPDCSSAYICGTGPQTRTATCSREPAGNCDPGNEPALTQTCDTGKTCTWQTQGRWYPYPAPVPNMFDPGSHAQTGDVSLVVPTMQKSQGLQVLASTVIQTTAPNISTIKYILQLSGTPFAMLFPTLTCANDQTIGVLTFANNTSTLCLVYDPASQDLCFAQNFGEQPIQLTWTSGAAALTWQNVNNFIPAPYFCLGYVY